MNSIDKYKFEFEMEIVSSIDYLRYLYKTMSPDLEREEGDPRSHIELRDDSLYIYIASNSQSKFVGIINTIVRLATVLDKLYRK